MTMRISATREILAAYGDYEDLVIILSTTDKSNNHNYRKSSRDHSLFMHPILAAMKHRRYKNTSMKVVCSMRNTSHSGLLKSKDQHGINDIPRASRHC